MTRPVLAEITEGLGEVLAEVAATAATRTGDLASTALEHVGDVPERLGELARERLGAPPRRRSRAPWVLLVLAVAAVVAVVWWRRSQPSARYEEPRDASPGGADDSPAASTGR